VAAETAGLTAIANGISLQTLPEHLSRADYLHWLNRSDILILPYEAEAYRERTSGIFTEGIIAGKLPLVTPHTWMARELADYGLTDLVIDWGQPTRVIEKILEITANPALKSKIKVMQSVYQQQHNIASFAERLNAIYQPLRSESPAESHG
jgi:hypothetical protein